MENKPNFPNTSEKLDHLKIVRDVILGAEQRIMAEYERVENFRGARLNTILHIVHGHIELAYYEKTDPLSKEDENKYAEINSRLSAIKNSVNEIHGEIPEAEIAKVLKDLYEILNYLP